MIDIKDIAVIIPSLNPDDKLLHLLQDLKDAEFSHIIVVNDGSSCKYDFYFEQAKSEYGCDVVTHAVNQGKGRALKTAFNYILTDCPDCTVAVAVDSDGQHRIKDIINVAKETADHPHALVFGCRNFSKENTNIPSKNRFGNVTTSRALRLFCGITLSDTQTGLRGFSRDTMRCFLATEGERFEYEMNMILDADENNIEIREVPIETVYLEGNKSSHFNPLIDSIKIYSVFLKFIASSLLAFGIDIGLYSIFTWLLADAISTPISMELAIIISSYVARILSALCNYTVNRKSVFKSNAAQGRSVLRYILLCIVQISISAFGTATLFSMLNWNETLLKFLVDIFLFIISFQIQRNWVFKKK
ncbi:MAG: bifunctional glycosyltransferase family 2/GtrA family protein [Clostridia bacterium]|nr:bifunctional glycosyltransferase family 2/GtrA family protein [Clostridia bacterium]